MRGRGAVQAILRLPRWAGMATIWVYQKTISPVIGPRCRYYPSCSHYGYTALDRHGLIRGSALTGWRILRCNPWSVGGVDDVPGIGEPLFRQREPQWSAGPSRVRDEERGTGVSIAGKKEEA